MSDSSKPKRATTAKAHTRSVSSVEIQSAKRLKPWQHNTLTSKKSILKSKSLKSVLPPAKLHTISDRLKDVSFRLKQAEQMPRVCYEKTKLIKAIDDILELA